MRNNANRVTARMFGWATGLLAIAALVVVGCGGGGDESGGGDELWHAQKLDRSVGRVGGLDLLHQHHDALGAGHRVAGAGRHMDAVQLDVLAGVDALGASSMWVAVPLAAFFTP